MFGPIFNLIYNEARKVWCYRGLLAAISGSIFLAAAVIIFALPDVYRASGQILVSEQTSVIKAAEGVSLGGGDFTDTQVVQKRMLNDEVLRKVYRRAYPKATAEEVAAAAPGIGSRAKIAPGEEGFINFTYSDSNADRTQKIASALIHQFIAESVDRNVHELKLASTFLDQQIASYAGQLASVQAEMGAFRRQHPGVSLAVVAPVASGGQSSGAADVAGARAELAAVMGRGPRAAAAVTAPQDGAIAEAEGRLAGMLTQYTEQHPDVISTRRQIAALKAQRAQYLASAPPPVVSADPAVAAARARLAAAQARARAGGGSISSSVDAADLSSQWAEMSRKRDTLAENHQQLIARREAARLSQVVYGTQDTGLYQITREPSAPGGPSGPDRKLYLAAAAIFALGAGVAAAYLRAGIAGIFVSPRELENAVQLPVIGTVSWEPAWHVSKTKRSTPALPAR